VSQFVRVIGLCLYSFNFTVFMPLIMFLIIWIYCDILKWHFLDSVGYYPAANSRHLNVNTRVMRTGTSHSPRDTTNKNFIANGNQCSTRITLQQNVHALKYTIHNTIALWQVTKIQSRWALGAEMQQKISHEIKTTSVSVDLWQLH